MPYLTNIIQQTETNTDFRKVLFTGTRSQLVIMSIPPEGEVGTEIHKYTEQTLFFLSGTGQAILNGKTSPIVPGDVVVVTPGTEHNFINTGTVPLKIYTVYAPPNHIDGTIENTKATADANVKDEAYGNQPK
jgi:mannose-6-phosphate isomerase-like protein (cupin superfamily)